MSGLFSRTPTDEEKRHYVVQLGGIPPWRCFWGMVGMFAIGLLLGLSLS